MADDDTRDLLAQAGMQEVVTYSLTTLEALSHVLPKEDLVIYPPLRVVNPISAEHEYLRPTLRASMLQTIAANLRFQKGADREEFLNVGRRKSRDDRPPIGNDGDQALGVELPERLADRNPAHLVLHSNGILPKLGAFGDRASNDLFTQLIGDRRGQRLSRNCGFWCGAKVHLKFDA